LRICLLSYRSKPNCGGQGVYIRNLSRALRGLGHKVDVISGTPVCELDDGVNLIHLPSLDLYNPDDLFRTPRFKELLDPINLMEWLGVSSQGFPEPFTFGLRAYAYLRRHYRCYDIVHDNQCLAYGIIGISRLLPTTATIHHPITMDRDIAIKAAPSFYAKLKEMRWHSFTGMQKRVAKRIQHLITVSHSAKKDISRAFGIPAKNFDVVLNGIRTDVFQPMPEIKAQAHRIIVTTSSDVPLKGLNYLLKAVALVAAVRKIRLVVVGTPKKNGAIVKLIRALGIGHLITFTGRISDNEFVRQYAKAALAIVPSVYEGFGLPAGEAMACGRPVISTTAGALPEVVGDSGMMVPPADHHALAVAINTLFDNTDYANHLGLNGLGRVRQLFTWDQAARQTVATYRKVIHAYG
jgi:glycosyltransferase involved in cell wall biosynthesis